MEKKKILIAPQNWGLGHATRCIPVIEQLEQAGFEPVIASDGAALLVLRDAFPHLQSYELPSYAIRYTKKGNLLKWYLLLRTPWILRIAFLEHLTVKKILKAGSFSGVISDGRFGVWSNSIPSVYLTHQLRVFSGSTTWITTMIHAYAMKKFTQVWVPDRPGSDNLSGALGHLRHPLQRVRYMDILSRLQKKGLPVIYEVTILLSGPEPQRSILEEILLARLEYSGRKVLFLRGVMNGSTRHSTDPNMHIVNYLLGKELEQALNASGIIICRSGYSSLMDLRRLGKKAVIIPTPGQYEQEYLAQRCAKNDWLATCSQQAFSVTHLDQAARSSGLPDGGGTGSLSSLFTLFQGK